jgi:hypothetical protein
MWCNYPCWEANVTEADVTKALPYLNPKGQWDNSMAMKV